MSGAALFGNNASRTTLKNLVEFKAGKMTMKGKMVYPDTRKGQIYVYQSNDSLMHFCWKDRTTGFVEDDLIIFPDDCEFKHVPQCKTGRVYVLRFKASGKKFFVWLQSLKTDKDEEYCRKINEVLNDLPTPDTQRSGNPNAEGDLQNLLNNMSQQQLIQLFGGVGQIGGISNLLGTMTRPQVAQSARASTTTASSDSTRNTTSRAASQMISSPSSTNDTSKSSSDSKPATKTPAPSTPATTTSSNNKIQLSDLQNFLSDIPPVPPVPPVGAEILVQTLALLGSWGSSSGIVCCFRPATAQLIVRQRGVATELTNAIRAAISASENLERDMSPHLPPGDQLCTTLLSPQFSQALSMFWSALQSGQAGPVIQQFGLGPDAVNAAASGNIEEFVSALETEAKTGQEQTQQGQEDTSAKQASPTASSDKKDDDEGMALD